MTMPSLKRFMSKERLLWWFGTPLIMALLVWGPYLLRALLLGHDAWWSIPFVGDAVFDTAAYLQTVGHAALGIPQARLIGSFARLVHVLARMFPGASVAELWLITRWLSAFMSLWTGAWAIRMWSGLSVRISRILSIGLWLSLGLVLGMKPGMFSWLLPMAFIGFGLMPLILDRLNAGRVLSALCLSVLAAAVTSVYPWYVLFVVIWLGSTWLMHLTRTVRTAVGWWTAAAIGTSLVGSAATWWTIHTVQGTFLLDYYSRLAFLPSRMPFVSGTVLLTLLWVILFIPIARRVVGSGARQAEIVIVAWVSLLMCFLSSPLTGSFIQNDHFRSPVVIVSWLSMALVWHLTRSAEVRIHPASSVTRVAMWTLLAISGAYTLRILAAPYAWNHDLLNVLHLTHWFALTFTTVLIIRWLSGRAAMSPQLFVMWVSGAAMIIGSVAWAATLTFEFRSMSQLESSAPLFSWVELYVSTEKAICADHGGDGFSLDDQLSAITGRVVHFAHTDQYHEEFSADYLNRMKTIVGFYDVRRSGDEDAWKVQSAFNQFIACEDFPWQTRVLHLFGVSQERIDMLTGCPRQAMDARWSYVAQGSNESHPDAAAFKRVCPYVVIPDRTKPFWHLPEGYTETRVMNGVSVWSAN